MDPLLASEQVNASVLVTLLGGIFVFCSVPASLWVFTGPKMAEDPILPMTKEQVSSCQAMYFVGFATGVLIMPVADKVGRKKFIYVCLAGGLAGAITSVSATKIWMYVVSIYIIGLCVPSATSVSYLLVLESLPDRFRTTVVILLNVGYSICIALMATACGAVTRDVAWRHETLIWYFPMVILLLVGPFFVKDPPRPAGSRNNSSDDTMALFRRPLFGRLVGNIVCWTTVSVSYYGLTASAGNLSEDIYLNMVLFSVVDVVGYLIPGLLISQFGIQRTQAYSFMLAAIILFVSAFLGGRSRIALALAGRLFIDVAFLTCYMYIVQCFPETCRSSAMGGVNFFSRLGSVLTPFCATLPLSLVNTVLATMCLAGVASTLALGNYRSDRR